MKNLRTKLLFIFLLIITVQICNSQNLELNLTPEKSYYQNNKTTVQMEYKSQGETLNSKISYGGNMEYKVIERKDSLYKMEVKYQNLNFLIDSGDSEISANTRDTDSINLLTFVLKEIIKSPFEISITKYGKVKSIKIDTVFENLKKSLSIRPEIPEAEKEQIINEMRQYFGEKALKGSIEVLTAIYPKKPVKKGDTWENQIRLESISRLTMINHFELLERNKNITVINEDSKTLTDKHPEFIEKNGEFVRTTTEGNIHSTYKIDSKTGWIIEAEIVQNITGTTEKKWKKDSAIVIANPFTYNSSIKIESN